MYKVSVIIPNYCHAAYLEQRIDSVLSQTYQDFEVIILDDNSPDDGLSRMVIEKYRENPHVSHIVYNDENSGSTFKQWDKGISLAEGEYIWIAESDDYCSPFFLESLMKVIDKNLNVSLAYCQSVWVNKEGKVIKKTLSSGGARIYDTKCFIEWFMLLGNGVTNASSAVFLKDAALNIDKEYAKYKGAGDRLFWIKIAEQGNVAVINEGLNYFRQHGDNTTSRCYVNGTNFFEDKKIFDKICHKYNISYKNQIFVFQETLKFAKQINFASEAIRRRVFEVWTMPTFLKMIKPFYQTYDSLITILRRHLRQKS